MAPRGYSVTIPVSQKIGAVPVAGVNPFRDAAAKPTWAHLTRLAGDCIAILFEELRQRIGRIEGLIEELHYCGESQGWAPRYRLGETTLFTAHISPGRLEVAVELEAPVVEKVLRSQRLSAATKEAIRNAPVSAGITQARVQLSNSAAVRALAGLVALKSRLVLPPQ